jgi:hypothetical protein
MRYKVTLPELINSISILSKKNTMPKQNMKITETAPKPISKR